MRLAILNYLKANKKALAPLVVSDNLPWADNKGPLYHHNRKHIYVDIDQISQSPAINDLKGGGAVDEIRIVRVYFVTDAKQTIANLEDVIDIIMDARLTTGITGVISRTCQVKQTYESDDLVTEFEFSFRKLITN